jgi:hypothetical protein
MTTRSATTWTRLIVGFVVVYGVLAIGTALDSSVRSGLLTLAAVLVAVALTEWMQARSARVVVCARLGLGAPGVPALLAATAVSLLVLSVYPLTGALTGSTVALRRTGPGCSSGCSRCTGWPRNCSGEDSSSGGCARPTRSGRRSGGACPSSSRRTSRSC